MGKYNNAVSAYRALNGLICIYKPANVPLRQVQHTIITNLCKDLNQLPGRPQEKRVEIVGSTNAPMTVKLVPNLADNPLACGPRYLNEDFRCTYATHLGLFSSGVLLIGINAGTRLTYHINMARPTRAYKVHGQLGKATDTYLWNGKTVERATFGHVTRAKMDQVLANMQAAHQRTMYELCGVHKDSQSAYELASQGLLRPASSKLPIVYGMKCVHFQPPDFTLEIQAVNEYDRYLWTLVHELGVQLKTAAYCTGVQCIRQGRFNTDIALLRKHWQLQHILDNMDLCHRLIEDYDDILKPQSATLGL